MVAFVGAPGPWMENLPPKLHYEISAVITPSVRARDGYPVVFFGHGVGNNKEQSSVATQLAGKGIATVSIDWALKVSARKTRARLCTRPSKRQTLAERGCYYTPQLKSAGRSRQPRQSASTTWLYQTMLAVVLRGMCGLQGRP